MESLIIRLSPRIKEIQRLMLEILMYDYSEMYNKYVSLVELIEENELIQDSIVTAHEKCQEQAEGDQGHDDEGDDDEGDDDKGDDDERDGDEGDEEKATN